MEEFFYKRFEEGHRGLPEEIKKRLGVYKPVLSLIKENFGEVRFVDLGCGRGEFVEIAASLGIDGIGVDCNSAMMVEKKTVGVTFVQANIQNWLKSQNDQQFHIVSAIHVLEHLSFEDTIDVVKEIERVLVPGGLVIIETPNPENIIVAGCNFYTDPTHEKPIPPSLLSYLFSDGDFKWVSVWRLNGPLLEKEKITLLDVLGGVSPDYSLLALKKSSNGSGSLDYKLKALIGKSPGYDLNQLGLFFETRFANEFSKLKFTTYQSVSAANELLDTVSGDFKKISGDFNRRIELLSNNLDKTIMQLSETNDRLYRVEELNTKAQEELRLVLHSRSWKITKPLRLLNRIGLRITQIIKNFFFNFKTLSLEEFISLYKIKIIKIFISWKMISKSSDIASWGNGSTGVSASRYLKIVKRHSKEKKND